MALNIETGSYVGNAVDDRWIVGLGFTPDIVIIAGENGSRSPCWRGPEHAGDVSSYFEAAGDKANLIQAIGANQFQIGTDIDVNRNGETFHYTIIELDSDVFRTGSYVGDGNDDRDIVVAAGWEPDFVLIKGDAGQMGVFKTDEMAGEISMEMGGGALANNNIQAFNANGFQVGDAARINANGVTYRYWACKKLQNVFASGTYVGDGNDDRDIVAGLQPDFMWANKDAVTPAIYRDSSWVGDLSKPIDGAVSAANMIQAFNPNGFQVGTDQRVNENTHTYYWVAWRDQESGGGPLAGRNERVTGLLEGLVY